MSWHEHAECLGRSDINWFPSHHTTAGPALAICQVCPVRTECLAEALTETYQNGIRGGHTPAERDGMVGRTPRKRVAQCGTEAGYSHHRRQAHTEPCQACRDAHREAAREREWLRRAGR